MIYLDGIIQGIINFIIIAGILFFIQSKENIDIYIHSDKKGIKLFIYGFLCSAILVIITGIAGVIYGTHRSILNLSKANFTILLFTFTQGFGYLSVAMLEEIIFRGVLLKVLSEKVSIFYAIIIQAVSFGVIHYIHFFQYGFKGVILINILRITLMGIIFAIFTVKFKSLMFAIGAHLSINLMQKVLIEPKSNINEMAYFMGINPAASSYVVVYEFVFLLIVLAILLSLVLFKKNSRYKV